MIKSAVAIVDDFYRYEAQLKPHLKEFLAQLHETGVKMCIATATERSLVEAALARCGVLDYFSESLPAPLWVPERTNQPFIGKP